jgi:D-3-phosphoglycerate dehydrogenase
MKIVLGFPATDDHVHQISQAARDADVELVGQEDLPAKILEADVFCGHAKVPIDWEEVVAKGKLKWIQSTAAGLDHCLHPAVVGSSIEVSGSSGLFADQVAEQTVALLMCLVRSMKTFLKSQEQRIYSRKATDDLTGKVIGILGLGGNGQRIAQVLRPFAKKIVGTDCFPNAPVDGLDQVYPESGLLQVLSQSDVVIVTLPLTDGTRQLIGEFELDAMRLGSYLINVGRGAVIDTSALVSKLEAGHFSGVGLDVVDPEPLPQESPLWDMENVVISPHVGAQSARRLGDTTDFFCENIRRRQANQSLLNWVDKQMGFPRPDHRVDLNWRSQLPST